MINFKEISSKKKIRYLWVGFVLFLLLVFKIVITNTIDLYFQNKELNEEVLKAENAPLKKKNLQRELYVLDKSLSPFIADSSKNGDYLLSLISEFCQKNNLTLKEFPEVVLDEEKEFIVETNVIVAEGNFINLLKLVYEIEQKSKIGRPASIGFIKEVDSKTKKSILRLKIYLQSIRIKNESSKS